MENNEEKDCSVSPDDSSLPLSSPFVTIQSLSPSYLFNRLTNLDPVFLLDLRASSLFESNHIYGSSSINMEKIDWNSSDLHLIQHSLLNLITTKRIYGKMILIFLTDQWLSQNEILLSQLTLILNNNLNQLENIHLTSIYVLDCPYDVFYQQYASCISFFQLNNEIKLQKSNYHSYPNIIIPKKLYLGHERHATDPHVLNHLNITHIIDATGVNGSEEVAMSMGISYLPLHLWDSPDQDISQFFAVTNEFIHTALTYPGDYTVLVHCRAGISRSTTLVIAYLLHLHALKNSSSSSSSQEVHELYTLFSSVCPISTASPLRDIMSYLLLQRPIIYPNRGFCQQLLSYESSLFLTNTVDAPATLSYQHYDEIKAHIRSALIWKSDICTISSNDDRPLPSIDDRHESSSQSIYEDDDYLQKLGAYQHDQDHAPKPVPNQRKFLKRGEGKQQRKVPQRSKQLASQEVVVMKENN